MLLCRACGEKESFHQSGSGRCDFYCRRDLDKEGEETDFETTDYDNYDDTDWDHPVCNKCRGDVSYVEEEEWNNFVFQVPTPPEPEKDWKKILGAPKKVVHTTRRRRR